MRVDVPELGKDAYVTIRRITIAERDAAHESHPEQAGAAIVAVSLDDPLMTVEEIRQLPIPVYERIGSAVWTFNNFMAVEESRIGDDGELLDENGNVLTDDAGEPRSPEVTLGADAAAARFPAVAE